MNPMRLEDWLRKEHVDGPIFGEVLDSFGNLDVMAGVAGSRRDKERHERTKEFYAVTDSHILHGWSTYHLTENNERITSIEVSCEMFALRCVAKLERRAQYKFDQGNPYRDHLEISVIFTADSGLGRLDFPQPQDDHERRLHLAFCEVLTKKVNSSGV